MTDLLEEYSNYYYNLFFRITVPVVYIVLLGFIFEFLDNEEIIGLKYLNNQLYFVVIIYSIIRIAVIFLFNRIMLVGWTNVMLTYICTIIFSIMGNIIIVNNSQYFFPSYDDIGSTFWLFIIAYFYKLISAQSNVYRARNNKSNDYIIRKYNKFKNKYQEIIVKKIVNDEIIDLFYAIMIFENFNRPKIMRLFENVFFYLFRIKTLGIMQVTTKERINDEESILIAIDLINTYYQKEQYIEKNNKLKLHNEKIKKRRDKNYVTVTNIYSNDVKYKNILLKYNNNYKYTNDVIGVYHCIKELKK
jgi:hypothetical protein